MCWALLVVQMIKNLPAIQFDPWVRKVPWRRKWQPIPLLLPRESHEQRNLVGYSSQDHRVGHNWVINTFISGQWYMTAGSQREKSCPWQRSWGRKPDKMQRRDLASGVPPEFSWTSTPQNQSRPDLLVLWFSTLLTLSGKVNLGLQSSAFERNFSAQTPSDGSLTCLTGSPRLFTTCELFTAPQPREAQSLKHLKDTEPFLKS